MAYRPQVKTSNGMVDLPLDAETIKGKTLLEQTYPVGAIYLSVDSTSPASLFGGTWERLKDKFLLGAGDTYSNGATGGSATHNHTLDNGYALLTLRGSSGYAYAYNVETSAYLPNAKCETADQFTSFDEWTVSRGVKLGGSTDSKNNLPPYLTVYIWKRTA